MEINQNRRKFILGGAALIVSAALPSRALSMTGSNLAVTDSSIKFLNLHTNEVFYLKNIDDKANLAEADYFFRDFRTGDVLPIDVNLLAQVTKLHKKVAKTNSVIEVISGYRSPITNANLASNSSGVVKNSLHMQGRAIDLNISGISIDDQYAAAKDLKLGGVGIYKRSKFIHIDSGPVRTWIGG